MQSKDHLLQYDPNKVQVPEPIVKFFDWVPKRQIMNLDKNEKVNRLFFKWTWDLEHGQYSEISDTQLFSLLSEVRIERLNLCKNKKPNVIRQIMFISFPLLTKLMLNDDFITSLQFMDHLDCPNLQAIALMNNKIVHIRSFKKTKFPNLNYIGLQRNFIQNFSPLLLMQTENFTQILVEVDKSDRVLGHDLTWMTKIKSAEFRQIKLLGQNRINMPNTKKKLKRKFQQLQIQDKFQNLRK